MQVSSVLVHCASLCLLYHYLVCSYSVPKSLDTEDILERSRHGIIPIELSLPVMSWGTLINLDQSGQPLFLALELPLACEQVLNLVVHLAIGKTKHEHVLTTCC